MATGSCPGVPEDPVTAVDPTSDLDGGSTQRQRADTLGGCRQLVNLTTVTVARKLLSTSHQLTALLVPGEAIIERRKPATMFIVLPAPTAPAYEGLTGRCCT
jgi:hypothetical protein